MVSSAGLLERSCRESIGDRADRKASVDPELILRTEHNEQKREQAAWEPIRNLDPEQATDPDENHYGTTEDHRRNRSEWLALALADHAVRDIQETNESETAVDQNHTGSASGPRASIP